MKPRLVVCAAHTWKMVAILAAMSCVGLILGCSAAIADLDRDLIPVKPLLGRDDLKQALDLIEPIRVKNANDAKVYEIIGEIHWRLGNLKDAKASYEKAKQLNAKSATAVAGLALVALSNEDVATGETLARQALELDKKLWLAHYAMGRALLAKQPPQIEPAFAELQKGQDIKKRDDGLDLFESGMGLIALAENDLEGAEANLIRARAHGNNTVEHVMNLASFYEKNKQWAQAVTLLEEMRKKVGDSPQVLYRLGHAFEAQRQYQDAFKSYQGALDLDANYVAATAALGHLTLLDSRRTPQAIELLKKALEQRPTLDVKLDLGIAYTRVGQFDDAVRLLQEVVSEKDTPSGKMALARAYLGTANPQPGIDLLTKDVDVGLEAQAADFVRVGVTYIRQKDNPSARMWIAKALAKDPENDEAIYWDGYFDLVDGKYDDALQKFRQRLAKNDRSAGTWLNVGMAYQGLGQLTEAEKAFLRATDLNPSLTSGQVQLGAIRSQLGRHAEAIKSYGAALDLDAANVQALRGRGVAYLIQEQYAVAIPDLQKAAQLDSGHADTWVRLGQALLNSGRRNEAKPAFEKALAIEPDNESAHEGLTLIAKSR